MLLCNFLVAQRLLKGGVTKSFLRFHPPPDLNALAKVLTMLKIDPAEVASASGGITAATLQVGFFE
jgi:hypothetical protein